MICTVIPATREHIPAIAANIRQADLDECWAVRAVLPTRALEMSLDCSDYARIGTADGVPGVMWGVQNMFYEPAGPTPYAYRQGLIWMVGTHLVDKYARVFLEHSRDEFEQLKREYSMIYNYVDQRNTKAIRWLRYLGFDVNPSTVPYGIMGRPFHEFSWRAEVKEEAA